MSKITVARVEFERQINPKKIQLELLAVLNDSVSCPMVVSDVHGKPKFMFIGGKTIYELKEATFNSVHRFLNAENVESALDMFQI